MPKILYIGEAFTTSTKTADKPLPIGGIIQGGYDICCVSNSRQKALDHANKLSDLGVNGNVTKITLATDFNPTSNSVYVEISPTGYTVSEHSTAPTAREFIYLPKEKQETLRIAM